MFRTISYAIISISSSIGIIGLIAILIGQIIEPQSAVISFASTTYQITDEASFQRDHALTVMDIERGLTLDLLEGVNVSHHSWSPDGTQVAMTVTEDDTSRIYVINQDGSNLRLVAAEGQLPQWAEDGETIIFRDNEVITQRYSIDLSDIDASMQRIPDAQPLMAERTLPAANAWRGDAYAMQVLRQNHQSPDGTQAVYTGVQPDESGAMFRIYMVNDEGKIHQLTDESYRDDYFPAWRP